MFSPALVNFVEMSHWFVKFVEYYDNLYKTAVEIQEESINNIQEKDGDIKDESLIWKTSSAMIKLTRFFVKYITSFEKLFKAVSKI